MSGDIGATPCHCGLQAWDSVAGLGLGCSLHDWQSCHSDHLGPSTLCTAFEIQGVSWMECYTVTTPSDTKLHHNGMWSHFTHLPLSEVGTYKRLTTSSCKSVDNI
jgi:hypothetical protein